MSEPDVVAEIGSWLAAPRLPEIYRDQLRRARDEIVALREWRHITEDRLRQLHTAGRAEALEEAARVCDWRAAEWIDTTSMTLGMVEDSAEASKCAAAIRALKDKP